MEIPSQYNPNETEDKWYEFWMENKLFRSVPDERESYTIVIPPPNVTGVLHMGHMLNNTIQDVLIRRARMRGYNACWVPGTDHASIATEAKVVKKLREKGIKKSDLSREEFLKHAWDWKEEYGGKILKQLQKLGASCDWDRTDFTMNPKYSESVIDTFLDLYEKGYIYRGERIINWDPAAKTALSDEEVVFKEEKSKLYYLKYQVVGSDEFLTIATTRPETILGDTAICINPDDDRFKHLHGKKAIVPMVNREIPIIQDGYVDMEFGTGCLKVTPAHDKNDYEIGQRHNLETINIMNEDGSLNEDAQFYIGKDRFDVRKEIIKDLEKLDIVLKIEDYDNKVGYSERTDVVIESRLSPQWWVKMEDIAKPALEVVMDDTIQIYPKKYKNTYNHWLTNIRDWCISRQLWWGHQIPAYYYGEGNENFVVAKTKEEALEKAKSQSGNSGMTLTDLRQDEDVMDTWFSSWLWPIAVFDGFKSKEEIDYYYPTKDLVTGPDIIFFWVARMVMAGMYHKDQIPFENVYFTGIVRDKQGRKMSKSLGNSPDPIELIKEYGADGVRVGLLLTAPAGNDIPFDPSLCEQGKKFANKIWNSFRLINMWESEDKPQPDSAKIAIEWLNSRFSQTLESINHSYDRYRLSEALMSTYKLVWDDYCSWYLEMVKPPYGEKIDSATLKASIDFLEKMLRVLHPFMPFLTEEVWQRIEERESIMLAQWPEVGTINDKVLTDFTLASEVITKVRNIRKQKNIAYRDALELFIKKNKAVSTEFDSVIKHLCNVEKIDATVEAMDNTFSFIVNGNEYFIPMGSTIDIGAEIEKIKAEIEYAQGSYRIVEKKLSNERFVNNAPEQVVAMERKKMEDAAAKIKILEDKLKSLG